MRVSNQQRTEWTENPVTTELLDLSTAELKKILETPILDCLCHGEPDKTHESVVNLEARGFAWLTLIDVLKGDWSYFEEIEDDSDGTEDESDE